MEQDNLIFIHSTGKSFFLEIFFIGAFGIIFGLIGIVLFGISLPFMIDEGISITKIALLSGGVTCFLIPGFLINYTIKKIRIKETKFNTKDHRFEILESNGMLSWIPFSEIESIEYRRDYKNSNNRRIMIEYTVFFQKTDGAWIDVYWFNSEKSAVSLVQKLKEFVQEKPNLHFTNHSLEPANHLFEIDMTRSDQTIFKWKNKTGKLESLLGYFLLFSFFSTFSLIAIAIDISIVFSIIFVFFASIFIGVAMYALWKELTIKEYVAELNLQEMLYGYKTIFGFRKKFSMSWSDFFGTQVNIPKNSYTDPSKARELWIVSKNMNDQLQNVKRKDQGNIFNLTDFLFILRKIPKFEFPGFTIGEILTLEKILDSKIAENRFP